MRLKGVGFVAVFVALFSCAIAAGVPPTGWLHTDAVAEPLKAARGGSFHILVILDIAPGFHVNANRLAEGQQNPTRVIAQPQDGLEFGEPKYPPSVGLTLEWSGSELWVFEDSITVRIPVTVARNATLGERRVDVELKYQGCSATSCFLPEGRELSVTVEIVPEGEAPSAVPVSSVAPSGIASARDAGLVVYLVALLLGGMALNLTPCVFPMIPITMTYFSQQSATRGRLLLLASVFALGLAASFTALGVAAAIAGAPLGVAMQSPWGVVVICIILALLMANAFGLFEIRLPGRVSSGLGARAGISGALVMGLVMGIVATPCVGAFVAALIALVASEGSVGFGAMSFFALGLGLGAPYLVLGLLTGWISRFPRGGAWMPWAKKVLGLSIGALIMWFLHPYLPKGVFWLAVLVLSVASAGYIGLVEGRDRWPWSRGFIVARIVMMAAIVAAGVGLYVRGTSERPQVEWSEWAPESLEEAGNAGRPAILFVTSDLCPACEKWKSRMFGDAGVIVESRRFRRVMLNLSRTSLARASATIEKYDAQNPPVVVILDADGKVVGQPLRDIPTPEEFLKLMRSVGGGSGPAGKAPLER